MTFRQVDGGDMEYVPMTGREFKTARQEFQMGKREFGELLGYTGEPANICSTMRRFETGRREVPPSAERIIMLLRWFKEDHGHLPDLDGGTRGPGQPRPSVGEGGANAE